MEVQTLGPDVQLDLMLGGTCDGVWRQQIALPLLAHAPHVNWFNPEKPPDAWEPSMRASEEGAKTQARFLLWVIAPTSSSLASLVEVSRFLYGLRDHQRLVLVMGPDIPEGTVIEGQLLAGSSLDAVNRCRGYARDMVRLRIWDQPCLTMFWVAEPGDSAAGIYPTTDAAIEAAMRHILNQLHHGWA